MFTLQVALVRAQDLPASDFGFMGLGGKSDPYVTLKVGRTQHKSTTISSSLNPKWTPPEVFQFHVDKPQEKCLEVHVFDYDRINADDLLGTANIALAPFLESRYSELQAFDIDVAPEFQKQKRKSTIYLDIKLMRIDRVDLVLELWENQRYDIVRNWTADPAVVGSDERRRWSAVNDAVTSSDAFEDVAPKCPPHLTAEGWTLDVSQGDANSWVYAPSFSGPWQDAAFTLAKVRRRKWINKCRQPDNERDRS